METASSVTTAVRSGLAKRLRRGRLACMLFGLWKWIRVRVEQGKTARLVGSRRFSRLFLLTLGFAAKGRRLLPFRRELMRRCAIGVMRLWCNSFWPDSGASVHRHLANLKVTGQARRRNFLSGFNVVRLPPVERSAQPQTEWPRRTLPVFRQRISGNFLPYHRTQPASSPRPRRDGPCEASPGLALCGEPRRQTRWRDDALLRRR